MKRKNWLYGAQGFINPKNIIGIAIVIAALMITSAVVELQQSKAELKTLLNDEAVSVIRTIEQSSLNTVISNNELEELVSLRLLGTARNVKRLDSLNLVTQPLLDNIAFENSVFRINIFNSDGEKVFTNVSDDTIHQEHNRNNPPREYFKTLIEENKNEAVIGFKKSRHDEGKRFAVAVKRAASKGGIIVVNIDAEYMIQFRNRIGLNKLIENIGRVEGIGYIVLQDNKGVLASSKPENKFSPVIEDNFLQTVYSGDSIHSRVFTVNNIDYYEAVRTIKINGETLGLLRIGLEMDEMNSLESRMINRGIITTVILVIIGVIVLSILNMNQNLKFVSAEYNKIQTFSGNILQNMADSVISTDMQGKIRIFNKNAEVLFNKKSSELAGSDLCSIFDSRLDVIKNSLNSRKGLSNNEIIYISDDKQKKVLNITTTFTHDASGESESFTAVIKDLTDIKKMEETVKQKEKLSAMGELASGVAHEVRNPLNAMSMIAQRIGKEFVNDENKQNLQPLVSVMLSESKRVNKIIEDFLKFARPPKLNSGKFNTAALLSELKEIGEAACNSKSLIFTVNEKDNKEIFADKELLKQALLNLLINSIDATPEKGSITLDAYSFNGNYCFKLKDTGEGISSDNIKKIFDLYYTTKSKGSGLGLSIVQQIVSQHNGHIEAESSPGTGSEFTIIIPLIQ